MLDTEIKASMSVNMDTHKRPNRSYTVEIIDPSAASYAAATSIKTEEICCHNKISNGSKFEAT